MSTPCCTAIHEGPTPEKLEALREFMKEFGLQLTGEDDPQAADYSKLLKRIKGRPDAGLLQTVMLRSLRQAKYEPENIGHFGLGYEAYTHFTSPIRRYPGSAGASRHQGRAARQEIQARAEVGRTGRALLDDRAPRRRCDARCRGLAEMFLHARPSGQRVHRHGHRRSPASACSCRWTICMSKGWCTSPNSARTITSSMPPSINCSASAPDNAIASATACRCASCKVDMESTKIDFVLHELIETRTWPPGRAYDGQEVCALTKPAKGKTREKKHHG